PCHRRRRPRPGHDRAADPHPGRAPAGRAAADRRGARRDRAGRGHRDARRLRRQRGPGPLHLPGPRLPELPPDDRRLPAGDRARPGAGPRPAADPAPEHPARTARLLNPPPPPEENPMTHHSTRRHLLGALGLGGIALGAAACGSSDPFEEGDTGGTGGNGSDGGGESGGGTIAIGSQAYYSNEIIAELFAQVLEGEGLTVDRQYQIGQREVYMPEL